MKIVQVLNHFLPEYSAGTEIYVWSLCKHLQKYDISTKIVIPNYGMTLSNDYTYDNIQVHQYAEPSIVDRSLLLGNTEPDGLINFENYLKVEKPDIVHFHEFNGSNGIGISHVKVAKKLGIKIVITFHLAKYACYTSKLIDSNNNKCDGKISLIKCSLCNLKNKGYNLLNYPVSYFSFLLNSISFNTLTWSNQIGTALGTVALIEKHRQALKYFVENADKVICLSNWFKDVLLVNDLDKEKINYIPQGLPFKFNVSNKVISKQIPLKLLYIGRITHLKGLDLLINAIITLPTQLVELSIYGYSDGTDYEENLKLKTKNCNNIRWRNKLTYEKVCLVMANYDLLCLCSKITEMSPLIIQEANSVQLPVLASDVKGNLELIKHEYNGLLFESNSVDSLRCQILNVLNNRNLLESIKKNIPQPINFDEISLQHLHLYNSLT